MPGRSTFPADGGADDADGAAARRAAEGTGERAAGPAGGGWLRNRFERRVGKEPLTRINDILANLMEAERRAGSGMS